LPKPADLAERCIVGAGLPALRRFPSEGTE